MYTNGGVVSLPAHSLISGGGMILNTSPDPKYQKLQELVNNSYSIRRDIFAKLLDRRRNIDDECGYPTPQSTVNRPLTPQQWSELVDWDPIANRINSLMADEAFKTKFEVYEDPDNKTLTKYEEAVDNLSNQLTQEPSHYRDEQGTSITDHLKRAWIEAGRGRYGVLLLGFNDTTGDGVSGGKTLASEVTPVKYTDDPKKGLRLLYLRAFPEHQASIASVVSDPNSPRFGQPELYNISFGDTTNEDTVTDITLQTYSAQVHWSRIIHINRNPTSHPWMGRPECQSIIKPICNLQKIIGADSEGRWKMAFTSLSFESVPGFENYNTEEMKNLIEEYENGLQRAFALVGFTAKTLAPTVVDPTPGVEINLRLIALNKRIPKRILEGSERGELSSSGDRIEWQEEVREYCNTAVNPRLVIPFYNRLINVGVLPLPPNGFQVDWPDIAALSQEEKLALGKSTIDILGVYADKGLDALMTPIDLYTRVLNYSQEDAESTVDAVLDRTDDDGDKTRNPLLSTVGGVTAIVELFKAGSEGAIDIDQLKGVLKLVFQLDSKTIDNIVGDKLKELPEPMPGQGGGFGKKPAIPVNTEKDLLSNVFCPTGKDGGVDPTCGNGESGSPHPSGADIAKGTVVRIKPGVDKVTVGGKDYAVKQRPMSTDQASAERKVSELASIAGVQVPKTTTTTMPNGKTAIVTDWAAGTPLVKMDKADRQKFLQSVPKTDIDKHLTFDYLLGHGDVHNGNFIAGKDGKLHGIDKELWGHNGGQGNATRFDTPHYLKDIVPSGHSSLHRLDRKTVETAVNKGEEMAKHLDSIGDKKNAKGVRNRASVLSEFLKNDDNNLTTGKLSVVSGKGVPGGFFKKLFG